MSPSHIQRSGWAVLIGFHSGWGRNVLLQEPKAIRNESGVLPGKGPIGGGGVQAESKMEKKRTAVGLKKIKAFHSFTFFTNGQPL